jgi:hypothetical protein
MLKDSSSEEYGAMEVTPSIRIEGRDSVALFARIQDVLLQILARKPTLLTKIIRGFLQSLQSNSGIVSRITPLWLPSTSTFFPTHYNHPIISPRLLGSVHCGASDIHEVQGTGTAPVFG